MMGAHRLSSSTAGVKGSSRKAVELPLKVLHIFVWSPSAQNASLSPQHGGIQEMIALKLRGVRTRYSPMWGSPPGLFRLFFGTLISRK